MKPITAVASAAGRIDLFSLGHSPATDSHALHRSFNGQAWTGAWDDAGGVFLSTLAATARGDAVVDAFGLGTDGTMFHRSWNGQAWVGAWEGLGGQFTSAPAAVSAHPGTVEVFALGADRALLQRHFDGQRWSPAWSSWGGRFTSQPAVLAGAAGRLDAFAVGTDFTMQHRALTSGGWGPWTNLGGLFTSPPTAVAWRTAPVNTAGDGRPGASGGSERVSVFGLGLDDTLWCKTWDGSQWSPQWQALGGPFRGAVAAVSCAAGSVDLFALDPAGALRHGRLNGAAVGTWENLGGSLLAPPAAVSTAFGQIDVFGIGKDQAVFQQRLRGGLWQAQWTELSGNSLLPNRYRFSLDAMDIDNTRSLHQDTDHLAVTLTVGGRRVQTLTRHLGDVNNGHFPLNLVFDPVTVDLGEFVVFNYAIVNQGHGEPGLVEKALRQAGAALADKGVKAVTSAGGVLVGAQIGSVVMPVIGSILGAAAGWLVESLADILFANCDGPVAMEQALLSGKSMRSATLAGQAITQQTTHHGHSHRAGCRDSLYRVSWSYRRAEGL